MSNICLYIYIVNLFRRDVNEITFKWVTRVDDSSIYGDGDVDGEREREKEEEGEE